MARRSRSRWARRRAAWSYTVRGDDAYAQGTAALPVVSITANSGGNFENVATTGTVLTSVTDDADSDDGDLERDGAGQCGRRRDDHVHGDGGQAVTGSDLVVTLSNGQTITIPVGRPGHRGVRGARR